MIQSVTIHLSDGRRLKWEFDFSTQGTIRMRNVFLKGIPDWIKLDYCQCPACTLDPSEYPTCPVADILAGYAYDLADRKSYEQVGVDVYRTDDPPLLLENIPLQTVVRELVRLAVFQYECPVGRRVKPAMTRLPPFPTNDEILYAFARAFAREVRQEDGSLSGEQLKFLASLHDIFGHLSARLDNVGRGDAHLNGIVILHSLAVLFALSAPELIRALSLTPRAREELE